MITIYLLLVSISKLHGYGYDSGTDQGACGAQYRTSRMHKPPCDLAHQSYCVTAGTSYPWHAVRRFVRENQGLMRRMYGDQRHLNVLRAEFPEEELHFSEFADYPRRFGKEDSHFDNELFFNEEENSKKGDILNTKFVYSVEPTISIKLGEFNRPPFFRPTTQRTTVSTTSTSTTIILNSTETVEETTTETTTNSVDPTSSVGSSTDTTAYQTTEETSTEASKITETVKGEVLFQDVVEDDKEEPEKEENQINYNLKGVNACPVKEEVVAPFWANNTRGELLALLNLYPYEQYVHWEKCTFENRQMYCRDGCRCEQQYRLHRLLAYDPNNECRGIFSDWFRFPSCCVCKCYDMPAEFRVTSRSPRKKSVENVPDWFRRRNRMNTDD